MPIGSMISDAEMLCYLRVLYLYYNECCITLFCDERDTNATQPCSPCTVTLAPTGHEPKRPPQVETVKGPGGGVRACAKVLLAITRPSCCTLMPRELTAMSSVVLRRHSKSPETCPGMLIRTTFPSAKWHDTVVRKRPDRDEHWRTYTQPWMPPGSDLRGASS